MNTQTKLAIIAIVVVIPLTSIAVYSTNSNQQYTPIGTSKVESIFSCPISCENSWRMLNDEMTVSFELSVAVTC